MYTHVRSSSTSKIEPQYEPFLRYIDDTTLEDTALQYTRPEPYSSTSKFLCSSLLVTITSLIWIMIFISINHFSGQSHHNIEPANLDHHNITTGAKLIECGNSTEEAKTRNCQYDVLMNSWIPAPCIDQDAIDEYLDDNSWTAYSDEAMTQRLVTIEEISESEVYYTSFRDHINHCAMLWKKQFWVLYKERYAIDTITANPMHTDHCATVLSETMDIDPKQATKVEKGYAGCWLRNQD